MSDGSSNASSSPIRIECDEKLNIVGNDRKCPNCGCIVYYPQNEPQYFNIVASYESFSHEPWDVAGNQLDDDDIFDYYLNN